MAGRGLLVFLPPRNPSNLQWSRQVEYRVLGGRLAQRATLRSAGRYHNLIRGLLGPWDKMTVLEDRGMVGVVEVAEVGELLPVAVAQSAESTSTLIGGGNMMPTRYLFQLLVADDVDWYIRDVRTPSSLKTSVLVGSSRSLRTLSSTVPIPNISNVSSLAWLYTLDLLAS